MKTTKPNGPAPQANEPRSRFPIIGSIASFFYVKRRLIAAQEAVRESAPGCQQVIAAADQTLRVLERSRAETIS